MAVFPLCAGGIALRYSLSGQEAEQVSATVSAAGREAAAPLSARDSGRSAPSEFDGR
jgi:hypothetical protein